MTADLTIRVATDADAEACLAIYTPYITDTVITYECSVPTCEEFASRIRNTLAFYPWLIAERDGAVVGYAYAGRFKPRAAFAWSVELSIYVAMDERHGGAGGALYRQLERCLAAQGIVNAYAYIVYPDHPDEFANYNSLEFHEHMGYELISVTREVANKFGRWYGLALVGKSLLPHAENPAPPVAFDGSLA